MVCRVVRPCWSVALMVVNAVALCTLGWQAIIHQLCHLKASKTLTLSGNEIPLTPFKTFSFLERVVSVMRRNPTRLRKLLPLPCLFNVTEMGVDDRGGKVAVGVVDCFEEKVGVMK